MADVAPRGTSLPAEPVDPETFQMQILAAFADGTLSKEDALRKLDELAARLAGNKDRLELVTTTGAQIYLELGGIYKDVANALEARQHVVKVRGYLARSKLLAKAPGDSSHTNKHADGDPVELARGQVSARYRDLSIDGAGMSFDFYRTHQSGAVYPNGPMGRAWDHNWNLWLREASPTTLSVSTGSLREDVFLLVTPRSAASDPTLYFAQTSGGHDVILRDPLADAFVRRSVGGQRVRYERDGSSDVFLAVESVDRHNNLATIQWADGRPTRVWINHASRVVRFHYDSVGRLDAVVDWSGRTVRYAYDDRDLLVAITLPATSEQRHGRTQHLTYEDRALLTSIAGADGRVHLEIQYGRAPGFLEDGRVVWQRDGDGEASFEYLDLVGRTGDPQGASRATRMRRRTGLSLDHWFNDAGNLLRRTSRVRDQDRRLATARWEWTYDLDGARTSSLSPVGALVQDRWGREQYHRQHGLALDVAIPAASAPTWRERLAFGTRVSTVSRAKPVAIGAPLPDSALVLPGDIYQEFTYHEEHQAITTESDPRDRTRRVTYSYLDGALVSRTIPAATAPDGSSIAPAITSYVNDDRGRVLEVLDSEGHRTRHTYFEDETRPSMGLPLDLPSLPPLSDISIAGFRRATEIGVGELIPARRSERDIDARGATLRSTDARGYSTLFEVGPHDQVTRLERVFVRDDGSSVSYITTRRFTPDAELRVERSIVVDDAGVAVGTAVRARKYDASGALVRESIGDEFAPGAWRATRYVHGGNGELVRTITPAGRFTVHRHDARGLEVSTIRAPRTRDEAVRETRFDRDGREIAKLDGTGRVRRMELDALGRVTREVVVTDRPVGASDGRPIAEREGDTWCRYYDETNKIIVEVVFEWIGPGSYRVLARTANVYDERGRRVRERRAWFTSPIPAALDAFGPGSEPVADGIETWWFYDQLDRLVEQRTGVVGDAGYRRERTRYDAVGQIRSFEVAAVEGDLETPILATSFVYDADGHLIETDRAEAIVEDDGTVRWEHVTERSGYDSLGREVRRTDGVGNVTTIRHDSRDLVTSTIDPRGNVVRTEFDVYRDRVAVLAGELFTRWTYDTDGYVRRQEHGNYASSTIREYETDPLGRRASLVLSPRTPLERRTSFGYDAADRLVEAVLPSGDVRTLTFDHHGRVASDVAATDIHAFRHDALGRLVEARTEQTLVSRRVDSLGHVREEIQSLVGKPDVTVERSVTPLGLTHELWWGGDGIRFLRDAAGRLLGAQRDSPNGPQTVWNRKHRGARVKADRIGELQIEHAYDSAGRGTSIVAATPSELVAKFTRSYDASSNVHADDRSTYEYDTHDRLIAIAPAQPSIALDERGNRRTDATNGTVSVDDLDRVASHIYDHNGNPVVIGDRTLRYDSRQRLVGVDRDGATIIAMIYDALGRRVARDGSRGATRWIYDGDMPLVEMRTSALPLVWIHGERIDQRVLALEGDTIYALLADASQTVRQVWSDGVVVDHLMFDAFGHQVAASVRSSGLPLLFMGRELDEELGWFHFRARHYDPSLGRFLQRDPIDADTTWSAYAAFRANPLRFADPHGTEPMVQKGSWNSGTREWTSKSYEEVQSYLGPTHNPQNHFYMADDDDVGNGPLLRDIQVLAGLRSMRRVFTTLLGRRSEVRVMLNRGHRHWGGYQFDGTNIVVDEDVIGVAGSGVRSLGSHYDLRGERFEDRGGRPTLAHELMHKELAMTGSSRTGDTFQRVSGPLGDYMRHFLTNREELDIVIRENAVRRELGLRARYGHHGSDERYAAWRVPGKHYKARTRLLHELYKKNNGDDIPLDPPPHLRDGPVAPGR